MRLARIAAILSLTVVCILSPVSFSNIVALSQSVPAEEITGYQEWNVSRTIDRDVRVKSGATLVIGKGVEITFINPGMNLLVDGNLFVEGTVLKPVSIKSNLPNGGSFSITANANSNVMIRNAEISNGGIVAYQVRGISTTATAASYRGALNIAGGKVDVQNTTFKQNKYAVVVSTAVAQVRVNRSRFIDNEFDVEAQSGDDFRYNWWNTPTGPKQTCEDYGTFHYCYYEKIDGAFDYSNHLVSEFFRDPVIIIPGIMGSWKKTQKSELELDPIFDTYDNLLETFENNGYESGKNLFVFPYEWRNSNVDTAKLLRTKIDEIKVETHWPKVDIVAHSMGGLVAREYIETLDGGSNIDQLVTLGTPHNGSPKSYLMWNGGEFGLKLRDAVAEAVFQQEAEENGYENIFEYVRTAPMSSIRELLPTYDYLEEKGSGTLRVYPDLYPKNPFLENLKSLANITKLIPIECTNIVGKTSDNETVERIRVDGASVELLNNPEKIVLWGHGKPDGYDVLGGDHGLELGIGDGTVPFDSATSIATDERIEVASEHSDLPSTTAKIVIKTLTGTDAIPDSLPLPAPTSYLLILPFSPIDIQIVSPSGKKVGKNFANGEIYDEIPGAYYTGYDTVNEFITIPNPEDGEYKIVTQGTGDGSYRIEATKISETNPGEAAKESTVSFSGNAIPSVQEEKTIALLPDDTVVSDEEGDTTPPVTTVSLTGTQGTNSWYTSDVTVTLTTADGDNGSGVDTTEYSLDNGMTWQTYADPFVVSTESTTTIQYFSTDKQGNKEEKKTETIKIDKTAPEAKISFNSTTQKLDISGIDALSSVSVVTVDKLEMKTSNKQMKNIKSWFAYWFDRHKKSLPDMLVTLTDEAGHTTSLTFEKTKDRNGFVFVRLLSIGYDGSEAILKDTDAQYKWRVDKKKGVYQLFAASLKIEAFRIEFHYNQKKNETWIMEKSQDLRDDDRDDDSDKRTIMKKLPGMVVPYLVSEQGGMRAKY